MAKIKPLKYPPSLTTQSWDKAKGLFARVAKGRTGVSDELTRAARAFTAAPWYSIPEPPPADKRTDEALDKVRKEYERAEVKFKALKVCFEDLSDFLTKSAKEFEKDKLIPKSAVTSLYQMSLDAKELASGLDWQTLNAENLKALDQAAEEEEAFGDEEEKEAAKLDKMIAEAWTPMKRFMRTTPTMDQYKRWRRYKVREIAGQVGKLAKYDKDVGRKFAEVVRKARRVWVDNSMPRNAEELDKRIDEEFVLLRKFKSIADRL